DNQDCRRGHMVDQDDPKNQLAQKDTSPDPGNQPMRKTYLRQLPSRIETGLPLRIDSRHEMPPEIEHHWTRQQQRDETGQAKDTGKQGFADQEQTWATA